MEVRDPGRLAGSLHRVPERVAREARENRPLDAPKLMDQLETLVTRDGLSDPQQLLPLLRELKIDERIPLIARNHAGRILKKIQK